MPTTYRRYQPDQPLLLPPDLQEWVPPGHLAHHVSDVVDALDLTSFYAPYEGDFRGNRQYITAGNLAENPRAFLFLMDYPNRSRVKIWGRAKVVEDDPALMDRLVDSGYAARPEQAIVFTLEAWDANCPQHITPRFTEAEYEGQLTDLHVRVRELEDELARLRDRH